MKQTKFILSGLVSLSVFLIYAISTQATTTYIKSIEISPSQTTVTTQEKTTAPLCKTGNEPWCSNIIGETTTYKAEDTKPVCQSPCIASGDTCSCPTYTGGGKTTPLCKTGNEPWCSTETTPLCRTGKEAWCPQAKPGSTALQTETKICKEGCTCEGDVTTCPTAEAQEIQTSVGSSQKMVSIEKKQGSLSIKGEKATATAKGKLAIQEEKLYLETSAGKKEIKVLPEEASAKATAITKVSAIELKEDSQQPIYSVKGIEQVKLFFLIPVSLQIETKVSAESGEVISVKKPWWSFLTR